MRKIIVLALCMGCTAGGPTGAMGDMGTVGATGPAGPQGPSGAVGSQGPVGPVGPAGSVGLQGLAGPAGPAGPTGSMGSLGSTGPAGATGAPGAQGIQGIQGIRGLTGATGPAGPMGPSMIVYSASNQQLGILLSATPNGEAYVSYGDAYTLVPDGLIIGMSRCTDPARCTYVWYTNNNCTGTPYVLDGFGYEPIANFVYVGFNNTLYTASTAVFSVNLAVQSRSLGQAGCVVQSVATSVHALTSVGAAISPAASMPWHMVMQ